MFPGKRNFYRIRTNHLLTNAWLVSFQTWHHILDAATPRVALRITQRTTAKIVSIQIQIIGAAFAHDLMEEEEEEEEEFVLSDSVVTLHVSSALGVVND